MAVDLDGVGDVARVLGGMVLGLGIMWLAFYRGERILRRLRRRG